MPMHMRKPPYVDVNSSMQCSGQICLDTAEPLSGYPLHRSMPIFRKMLLPLEMPCFLSTTAVTSLSDDM